LHGDPDKALSYILIVMPVNASCAGHIGPRDFGMPLLHFRGQTSGRFRDNLKRSCHRVEDKQIVAEPFVVEAVDEAFSENDVIADVKR
jgi:hypothetical protein